MGTVAIGCLFSAKSANWNPLPNELGWHDYRLTQYSSIERWWEESD